MRPSKMLLPIVVALSTTGVVTAGPIAYGVCQTGTYSSFILGAANMNS